MNYVFTTRLHIQSTSIPLIFYCTFFCKFFVGYRPNFLEFTQWNSQDYLWEPIYVQFTILKIFLSISINSIILNLGIEKIFILLSTRGRHIFNIHVYTKLSESSSECISYHGYNIFTCFLHINWWMVVDLYLIKKTVQNI